MLIMVTLAFIAAVSNQGDSSIHDARSLIQVIEALMHPVADFRCEFEGRLSYSGVTAENEKDRIAKDGLVESFGGVYVWKRGGDVFFTNFHKPAISNQITREDMAASSSKRTIEYYTRSNDKAVGRAEIRSFDDSNASDYGAMGTIFLLEKFREFAEKKTYETSITDDVIDGETFKVLNVFLKYDGQPNVLYHRYWINLRKNGHVVRAESYIENKMSARCDIELKRYSVQGEDVWMPAWGELKGYVGLSGQKPVWSDDPMSTQIIYIIGGTLSFNRNPPPETFSVKYKPGTPVSDSIRKLDFQYGQQKLPEKPTTRETEKLLAEQIRLAEEQQRMLVVAPVQGWESGGWLITGLCVLSVCLLVFLYVQRRSV